MGGTIRLVYPQWQGGMNPNYAEGARIMALLAPGGAGCETVEVPVSMDAAARTERSNGILGESALLAQTRAAYALLEDRAPDRVLTFGGDCSASQAPFDYLHGRYPAHTGLLWLDAHPDISRPGDCDHEHAMVLGNLLGEGAMTVSSLVRHPFAPQQVMFAGLVREKLLPHEAARNAVYQIPVAAPETLCDSSAPVTDWIRAHGFRQLLVHFDMDVLTAADFRSLLYNEPGLPPVDYATGRLTLAQAVRVIADAAHAAELVGLTIAEYLPWDAIHLREAFAGLDIFQA